MEKFISILGLFTMLGIAYAMSNNRRKIRLRILLWGISLQMLFATIVLGRGWVSYAGMFVMTAILVLFIFRNRFADVPNSTETAKRMALVAAGTILVAGVFYLSDALGLLLPIFVLLVAALIASRFLDFARYKPFILSAVLLNGWSLLVVRGVDGEALFAVISQKVQAFLSLTDLGSGFLFGKLVDPEYIDTFGAQFAFGVLPVIIFFAAIISILYHLGIMQTVIGAMSRFMRWTMGTSGAETLSCSANIFVGQLAAPLLVKPFLSRMTTSELMTVMVGGFATIAGSVLAAYTRMGIDPGDLIAASLMSAPAAIVIAKIMIPETGHPATQADALVSIQKTKNLLDAAVKGVGDGVKLAVNVGAMLLVFIAIIGFVDLILNYIDRLVDGILIGGAYRNYVGSSGFSPLSGEFTGIFPGSLRTLFGTILRPLAWILGVAWQDADKIGSILGTKIALNEFVAYAQLAEHVNAGEISQRSITIATYALCGFANFASVGMQIGGLSAMAPDRRGDLSKIALKAMIGGALASWSTAAIAGILL